MAPAIEIEPEIVAGETASLRFAAQAEWAATTVGARLSILRRARHMMAGMSQAFADAVPASLPRSQADTRVAELLPLLDACRFLERSAAKILASRTLGAFGRPVWLAGVSSEVQRVPFGHILILGPSNYPLFLPGVQALQALAAGNAVTWKPGTGGRPVADLFAEVFVRAGLPDGLLTVTDDSTDAAQDALAQRPDKVVLTGSAATGRAVLAQLAQTLTPCVAELSGCDAVIVLPSAPLDRVVQAIAFGMRLNGSATCMAPRRLLLVGATPQRREALVEALLTAFRWVGPISLPSRVADELTGLLREARFGGAQIHGEVASAQRPILVTHVTAAMRIGQADIFVPVISLIEIDDLPALFAAEQACPYALTASIFGDEGEARRLAEHLTAGTILINDIIVPTVDPRLPFGGRRQSGFGSTRGAEGLLEMTAAKVIAVRKNRTSRHYEPTTARHAALFDGLILATHSERHRQRWAGLRQLVAAARGFGRKP